jgi:undecaprenyl-diphosphatase
MSLLDMLILAVVQGVAEFLPISSSGHLVILGALLGIGEDSPTIVIILHAGTLASILVVYWRRILALLQSDQRVIPLLVVGTIPAGVLGVLIKTQAAWILDLPLLAGAMLLVTGGLLIGMAFLRDGKTEYRGLSWQAAWAVGAFQAVAILPGISRSGSTIFGGRLLGLRRDDSVTFSFLLAIPAILGATVLAVKDLLDEGISGEDVSILVTGAFMSFVIGIVSLLWLIRWSREGRLWWFALWCIPVGLLVIAMWGGGMF